MMNLTERTQPHHVVDDFPLSVGVQPLDLVSFLTAAALLGVVLLVACLIPARRAAAANPAAALRAE